MSSPKHFEAAGELTAEYQSLIDEAETDVGHYHDDTKDSTSNT